MGRGLEEGGLEEGSLEEGDLDELGEYRTL